MQWCQLGGWRGVGWEDGECGGDPPLGEELQAMHIC